jgi:hypothetical protein
MESRLERLLQDFRFDRMDRVFIDSARVDYPVVSLRTAEVCAH